MQEEYGRSIRDNPNHFIQHVSRIAYVCAAVSSASGTHISTESRNLTSNIIDEYLDSKSLLAEKLLISDESHSRIQDNHLQSSLRDVSSLSDGTAGAIHLSMFKVSGLDLTFVSILCALVCTQIIVFSTPADVSAEHNGKIRKLDQSKQLQHILECIFFAYPISATPAEVLSFTAAILKELQQRLRLEAHYFRGQDFMESASAAQLTTLCEFLTERCVEGWYPKHCLNVFIIILEVLKELKRRKQGKNKPSMDLLQVTQGIMRRLLLWILSQKMYLAKLL